MHVICALAVYSAMPCMMPCPCPFIAVSVYGVMLACLADIHFSSAVHTADYFPFRYVSLLFASYVGIYNVIDYIDLILTLCLQTLVPPLLSLAVPSSRGSLRLVSTIFFSTRPLPNLKTPPVCIFRGGGGDRYAKPTDSNLVASPGSTTGPTKQVCWTLSLDKEVV